MTTKGRGATIPHQTCRRLREAKNKQETASFMKKIELIAIAMNKNHLRISLEVQEGINEFIGQMGSIVR